MASFSSRSGTRGGWSGAGSWCGPGRRRSRQKAGRRRTAADVDALGGSVTTHRADGLYLGWQYAALHPEPGPPPRRPTPPEQERLNPDWATAQRREESMLNRPLRVAFGVAVLAGLVV